MMKKRAYNDYAAWRAASTAGNAGELTTTDTPPTYIYAQPMEGPVSVPSVWTDTEGWCAVRLPEPVIDPFVLREIRERAERGWPAGKDMPADRAQSLIADVLALLEALS